MNRDIDIGQLRTFLAVTEHGSMTHSANLRNLTQSAVSQQIRRLEDTLECELLVRSKSGVELTEAGRRLFPQAVQAIRTNDDLVASFLQTKIESQIRLGVTQDVAYSLLPAALSVFHKKQPDVHFTLISATSRELIRMLKEERVDMALTTDSEMQRTATLLFKKRLVWIGAIKGVAHKKSPLPVAVGSEDCPFRQAASKVLEKNKIAWRPVTQVGSLEPVFATLIADLAIAPFLPGTFPSNTQVIKKGLPKLPLFHLHLRKSERRLTLIEQEFFDLIAKEMQE